MERVLSALGATQLGTGITQVSYDGSGNPVISPSGTAKEVLLAHAGHQITASYALPYSGNAAYAIDGHPVYPPQGGPLDLFGWRLNTRGEAIFMQSDYSLSLYLKGGADIRPLDPAAYAMNAHDIVVNGQTVSAPQLVGSSTYYPTNGGEVGLGVLSEMDPASQTYQDTSLNALMNDGFGYTLDYGIQINDSGAALASGYDATGNPHGFLLVPIQSRVVNRDDPTLGWSANVLQSGLTPIYGGIQAGDMVSWTIPMSSWSSGTFTWSVTDSSGNAVIHYYR